MAGGVAHALVTGAGRGIGRAFALQLAHPHTRISVVDIDSASARRVVAELTVRGCRAKAFHCDVSERTEVEQLAAAVEDAAGPVDLLINNAGIMTAATSWNTPERDAKRVFEVNWWGVFHSCAVFAPRMVERRRGQVLNVASLAGLMALPQLAAYGASKAAVIAYSETLAAELAGSGVGVTTLCPSFVNTGFVERSSGRPQIRALGNRLLNLAGQSPQHVARCGLRAAARGKRFAVPSRSGALAWRAKQRSPNGFARAVSSVARLSAWLAPRVRCGLPTCLPT